MESPVPPCSRGVYHKVAAPYFFIIMYIVQLYKEDWTTLRMLGCRAVALPSTERIVISIPIILLKVALLRPTDALSKIL